MKFRLIIDKEKEEEVVATVHERTRLTDEIEQLVAREGAADEIVGYDEDVIKLLSVDEVEAFYIEDGKTYASYTDKKKYRVRLHLYELEAMLPKNFRKINKSNIANMNHIVKFRTSLNGAVDALFGSGFSDCISRRCFAELKRRYSL